MARKRLFKDSVELAEGCTAASHGVHNHREARDATLEWLLCCVGSRTQSTLRYLSPAQFELNAHASPLASQPDREGSTETRTKVHNRYVNERHVLRTRPAKGTLFPLWEGVHSEMVICLDSVLLRVFNCVQLPGYFQCDPISHKREPTPLF